MDTPAKRIRGRPAAIGSQLTADYVRLLRDYSPVGHTWLAPRRRLFRRSPQGLTLASLRTRAPGDAEAQEGARGGQAFLDNTGSPS
jgi:hypothetical protein